ncbi:MAG: hypothetical protein WCX23_03555 [Candidatus Paceibacterota bacterium]|jgi:hypothetical protein
MGNQKIKKLDEYAKQALQGLPQWSYPDFKIEKSEKNIFMGSGDAANTGKIFAKFLGGHALNVCNYQPFFEDLLIENPNIYIICASGGKDGTKMAQWLTQRGWQPKLITSNPEPPMGKFLKREDIFVFPSIVEPPTYNVSTYAAMIYWLLKENLQEIENAIKNLKVPNLRKHKFIFFMVGDKYEAIGRMATRKVAETLAGLGANGCGYSNAVHGMLIQPNKDRLIFCLNCEYDGPGNVYNLNIDSYLGSLLCLHYIIGKNQTDKDSENILRNYFENAKKQGWEFNKVW